MDKCKSCKVETPSAELEEFNGRCSYCDEAHEEVRLEQLYEDCESA